MEFQPGEARQVIKFNPVEKSFTDIGPDFSEGLKWSRGTISQSSFIYCPPVDFDHGILKIDTNTDTVTELDVNLLPERGDYRWRSCCAATLDGCIYFIPSNACCIMKLDPNNNDAISSIGDDVGGRKYKFEGTVVGIDGCVYDIPYYSKCILKYDPINDITSFVGEVAEKYFMCSGGLWEDMDVFTHTPAGMVKVKY